MTTQYNVVIYGNLTNTNGVLSGFSANNYATLPLNFNPVQRPFEVVFKFVGTDGVIWNVGDWTTSRGHISFEVSQNKLYAEAAANSTLSWSIEGVTTLSPNTNYWGKLTYNGVNTYSLYLSTDGTIWNTEGTATSNAFLADGSTQYNLIGIYVSNNVLEYAFNGSIDLNESYINIDGIRWWQGVTTVSNVQTKIQLRRDTAANWTSVNPVLLEGEVGLELDTGKSKVGDGSTAWNSLAYDKASTALQSSDLSGYANLTAIAQTFTGYNTFSQTIKTNQLADLESYGIFQSNTTEVTVGTTAKVLNLSGSGTRPTYNSNNIALYSDIPTVPTNISAFTNDSGYITGITSSDVTTALGYTPVNKAGDTMTGGLALSTNDIDNSSININNVSSIQRDITFNAATHRTAVIRSVVNSNNQCQLLLGVNNTSDDAPYGIRIVRNTSGYAYIDQFPQCNAIDGQWTTLNSEIKASYTLGAGATESWTISGLPNDSYTYEVMGTITASGTNLGVSVKSAIVNTNLCRAVTLSGQSSTFTIPIGTDHKIGLSNTNSNTSATINYLRIYAYRRIGTNS